MAMVFRGNAWVFGDNISTDLIMPGAVTWGHVRAEDRLKHCMSANRPGWAEQVSEGDLLVGGRNFGCGSSRGAHSMLRGLGIACVVVESASRIFLRNSINSGYPILICPGITSVVGEGEELEVNVETGEVRNLTNGKRVQGEAFPKDSPPAEILRAGGIETLLAERVTKLKIKGL